jgi:DNA-binding PadR family transcriptional regulator
MRLVANRPDEPETKPLTEPVLLILLSLANKPGHGYGLMQDIELLSKGRVRLSTGASYGALRRLFEDSWIERFEQTDTSREKQAYKLSPLGRKRLHLEISRMNHLTKAANARLKAREI